MDRKLQSTGVLPAPSNSTEMVDTAIHYLLHHVKNPVQVSNTIHYVCRLLAPYAFTNTGSEQGIELLNKVKLLKQVRSF